MAAGRKATVNRETGETKVKLELVIDGTGKCQASTGIGMLDHLIDQIARHGRGYAVIEAPLEGRDISGLDTDLVRHFLETFAAEAKLSLHARILSGVNDHHKVEALFKALAKALDTATSIDNRRGDEVPSTKGTI